jgi:hypothetical protein
MKYETLPVRGGGLVVRVEGVDEIYGDGENSDNGENVGKL